MIPSSFTILDALPVSPNGKIEYASLPVPPQQSPGGSSPSTPIEVMVEELWCTLLGIEHIGLDDNLFDAGADSLMATKAAGRICADLGVELSVPAIFETPTIKGMSRAVLDALLLTASMSSMTNLTLPTCPESNGRYDGGGAGQPGQPAPCRVFTDYGSIDAELVLPRGAQT